VGIGLAWVAVRIGFYETWILLFNILVAIYLGIYLEPALGRVVPDVGGGYKVFLNVLAISVGAFLVLHGIAYTFLTSQFRVPFPRAFDILVAGLLGFLAGFLVVSFAGLLFTLLPLRENTLARNLGLTRPDLQSNLGYVCWWGDLVNGLVEADRQSMECNEAVEELWKKVKAAKASRSEPAEPNAPADVNAPPKPAGPNRPNAPNPITFDYKSLEEGGSER
jgi:hypothetical protein